MKKTLYFLLSGWMLFLSIAFAQDPNRAPSGGANNPLAPLKKRLDDHKTKKEIFKKILEKDFKRTSVKDEDKKDKIDQLVTNILKNYNTSIETVANDLKNVIPEDKKLISTINKDLTSCDNICSSIEKNIQDGVYWMMYFNMTSNSTLWNEGKDEVITNTNNKIDSTIEKISGTQKKFLFIIISICVGCFILVLVLLIVAIKLWDKKYGDRLTDLEKANQTMSQVNIPGKIKDLQDDLKKIVLDFKNNLSSNLNNEEKGIATQITATLKDLPLNDLQTTLTNLPDQIIKKMSSTNGNSGNPTKTTNNRAVWLSNNSTNSSLKGNGGGESLQLDDSSLEKLCGAIVEKINIKSDINKVKESLKTLDTSIITPARGKVETLNQNAGALSGTIKKLSDTIIGLDEKLKNVSGEVEKVEEGANTKRAELLGDIKKAEENLNNIKNIIMQTADDVKANSTDNAEKISQKMAEAANTVANALQSVKDIQTKAIASVDEINEKALASVEDNNTKAMASMDEINQKVLASVEEINQKAMASIQDVNKKTEQINQASATLNSQMEGCRSREERLTRGAEGFGERLAELEKHITSLNGVVVGLSQLSQSLPLAVKAAELQQKLETANGMVKVKEEEVGKQATEIQQQKTTIQQKESVIQNKEAEIQQQKTTIQQKETAIQQKDTTIQQKDAEIQQQKTTIQQKDADIRQKNTTIQQKEAEIQQQKTTIQQKEAEILQKNTTIQQQEAEIRQKNTTIQQKDAEIRQKNTTIQQKDDEISRRQADSIELHSMYPKRLQEKAEYNQKFEELRTYARTENKEAKVCLHSIAVIGDILNNSLRPEMKELLLRTLYDFSRNFTIAMSLLEGQQSEETLKSLSVWLNFFNEIGDGVFALNLPAKGELFANDWMTSGNSNIQRISVVESWAVFEPNKPAPWRKASVR